MPYMRRASRPLKRIVARACLPCHRRVASRGNRSHGTMVKWKMYSPKMPGPLGSQTRVLILASFCGLSLRILRSLRIKAHNACATRDSSCTVHNNQGLNRKVCPCPRPQGCAQTANATQRQQPQEKSIACTQPLTTRLGSAPSTKGTTYNEWHCKNTETCQRQGMTTLASTRCATSTHTEL